MSQVKKLRRFATYSFLLMLATFVSALLGGKKVDYVSGGSFIVPSAHADVPSASDTGSPADTRDAAPGGPGPGNSDPFGGVNGTDAPDAGNENGNGTQYA
ncbi:MAG: hypothetical protein Q8O53_01795 [Candidatus Moranbacteria bacterium]|nr:hypothetical protein [Candidatus Moranbacteria bacterium]